MSTYWYFECMDHDPSLRSADEFTQHTDDDAFRRALRFTEQRPIAEDWYEWPASQDYFSRNALRFLYQHPKCRLELVNEYGERRAAPTLSEVCCHCGEPIGWRHVSGDRIFCNHPNPGSHRAEPVPVAPETPERNISPPEFPFQAEIENSVPDTREAHWQLYRNSALSLTAGDIEPQRVAFLWAWDAAVKATAARCAQIAGSDLYIEGDGYYGQGRSEAAAAIRTEYGNEEK